MEKRIWAVYIFHKFLSQIVFPAWFFCNTCSTLHATPCATGPRAPPTFPSTAPASVLHLIPHQKKKNLFSFGSHFRSFCVVHFTFHSVHSECVSHPLVRVLRGYFAKLLRHYFPCVSVCVFFTPFFLLLEIYICIYIFFLFGLCPFGTFRNYFVASRRAACDTCCVAAMCLHSAGNAVVIFLMGPDPRDSPSHPLKQHKKKNMGLYIYSRL